jgi:proton glutamate symport protein
MRRALSPAVRILAALVLGLAVGALGSGAPWAEALMPAADFVGGLWLSALRMTIVPLVVALLVTGIASTADAARSGGVAGRALGLMLGLLWLSAIIGWGLGELLWQAWPMPAEAGAALRAALSAQTQAPPPTPSLIDFFRSVIPTNPIEAAAGTQMLPLLVFTGLFAFAATRLGDERRLTLVGVFAAVRDAMLVVIGWVLWVAPLGVLALGFVVGARAGLGAAGALAHYVVSVSALGAAILLLAYALAVIGGRMGLSRFARAVIPAQAVAVSTQSSLASLPAMLEGARKLGIPSETAGIVLPMAVALFRCTGPAMNAGVAFYVAHWFGIELTPGQIMAGIALAATTTLGAVSLPGTITFVSSIAPIALALGVPIEPLLLLVAVETLPDIMRTVGNVTMNVAVTSTVARWTGGLGAKGAMAPADAPGRGAPRPG